MASMDEVKQLAGSDSGLCVVATTRTDGSVHASVVNAGVMTHPESGQEVVALVARGSARKVGLMRANGRASITFRRGWRWAGVEGQAEITDPAASPAGVDYRTWLREVFSAAGGTHDDWDTYDKVMADEGRVVVFITPDRVIGNG
ncbi:MAG: TIGR03618 family F420-dependent PPOX class oxidoreductase [Actinomycetia bacterium]|nr:TIGR03618 family F420-dependent PPOX class oxidoreductase [Actinomycetes bacterium]